ncbi:hypothetical protein MVES1_002917 [Malassezia vespertilionis]|uniref:uncharacterized protein n=1 Tax=Malassezia vespertilionis TaxID=2020962 RepID=UPI0024B18C5C|nr:uncharacterized protein MVES1_002917 [Malassezia vespertilionis]WFD07550.1 hypothetical protein MVES1_002917 [Malassezia vespertilionis]
METKNMPLLQTVHACLHLRLPGNDALESEQGVPLPRSPVANKIQFLSLFSDFFDSLSDSRTLKATLEYQIRSSNTLLQTLQRSSNVFDETVERRIRHESDAMESRFARLEGKVDDAIRRMDEAIASLANESTQNAANNKTVSPEK